MIQKIQLSVQLPWFYTRGLKIPVSAYDNKKLAFKKAGPSFRINRLTSIVKVYLDQNGFPKMDYVNSEKRANLTLSLGLNPYHKI